jgi:tRNA pseudouridine55 synthase
MAVKQELIKLNKKRGETPLECLEKFKIQNPEYKCEKMTYAGRLDPLAEGLLLILVGDECKNKEKYLGFDKEYIIDVLFGFSTDTYDILGKVTKYKKYLYEQLPKKDFYKSFVGKFNQKYPVFSSKTIKVILNARNMTGEETTKNRLPSRGDVPEKEVEIKDIKIIEEKTISKIDLDKYIIESINLVKGNFRQYKILKEWSNALQGSDLGEFNVITIKVNCTSGTYMRSLASSIGEKVKIPALALNIKRIKVGEFGI